MINNKHVVGYSLFTVLAIGLGVTLIVTNVDDNGFSDPIGNSIYNNSIQFINQIFVFKQNVTNVEVTPAQQPPSAASFVCCTNSTGSYENANSCSADIQDLEQNGWVYDSNAETLYKQFEVANFKSAFAWMIAVGLKAEQINHHPEWFNVYSTIQVTWTTHECNNNAGDLSNFDIEMAQFCDEVVVSVP